MEILSGKSLKIAQYLVKFSIATAAQIRRDVFEGGHPSCVYGKMQRLEKQKFVERMYFQGDGRPTGAYVLTQKGFRDCFRQIEQKTSIEKFRPSSLGHDLELVEIAYVFKRFGVQKYWTENQILANPEGMQDEGLWQITAFRPDALVQLPTPEGGDFFAVEYEASLKYSDAIKSKLNRYYDNEELCGVFFVCKSKEIFKAIRAVDKKYYAKVASKVLYITLEEFKKATDVLNFYDRDGEKLAIEEANPIGPE